MLFVWTRGVKAPTPEKWPEMLRDMNGKPLPVLASYTLAADEERLSLDELVKRYPAPAIAEDDDNS